MAMSSLQPSMSKTANYCLILYMARPPGAAIDDAPTPDLNLRASRIAAGARPHHHSLFNPARAEERLPTYGNSAREYCRAREARTRPLPQVRSDAVASLQRPVFANRESEQPRGAALP